MKVLFGMALRQTTGFVESLLRLVGLNWMVPDFSTLSRRQSETGPWRRESPSNNGRGHPVSRLQGAVAPADPLSGIAAQYPAGQRTARVSRSRAKGAERPWPRWGRESAQHGTPASMAVPNGAFAVPLGPAARPAHGARSISGLMKKHWRSALSRSPGATSVMPRCYPTCSVRSQRTSGSAASLPTVPGTHVNATTPLPTVAPMPSSRPARTRSPGRPSPPKPRRDMSRMRKRSGGPFPRRMDALCEVAGAAPYGAGLRPSGRRTPGPHRRPERIHRPRHTRHGSCGISPSGKKGNLGHHPICATESV